MARKTATCVETSLGSVDSNFVQIMIPDIMVKPPKKGEGSNLSIGIYSEKNYLAKKAKTM